MRQVLFYIPIFQSDSLPHGIPIYGYGLMLFLAFVLCVLIAGWRAQKNGICPKERVQDLAIWIIVFGIIGARVTFMIQYHNQFDSLGQFFKIWEGGLVLYGGVIGGVVGYALAYFLVLKKYNISTWKLADIIAPCAALGIGLGRVGCYFNGCCYGNVACVDCPAVHFPMTSRARSDLVERGLQTAAGFTLTEDDHTATVAQVEPGSPAWEAGLRPFDEIIKVNDQEINRYYDPDRKNHKTLWAYFVRDWPRGETDLKLRVRPRGKDPPEELPTFEPRTLGLHPTQLYESISMVLLFLFLSAFYAFRRHDGEVMVLFMLGYAVHRFLNEMLRNDTDPVAFGMTLSQNISVLVLLAGLGLGYWLWRKPVQYPAPA
jgi:prolipoprotein diacylglyceryltransferase